MCGFVGFIARGPLSAQDPHTVRAMASAIAHRGPDDEGVWTDDGAGVALAHRRLSIVDLSPAGHQPMASHSGRFVIVFNGEIYNHADVRESLAAEGKAPRWRGHSDTEVLIEAVAAWGVGPALQRCVGMFAFALWDRAERSLILARDRLGEKPLYYGLSGGTFLFGSELKALRRHPDWQGEIDRDALQMYTRRNHVPSPYSIYRGIHKLPPGTFLELKPGARDSTIHTYWDSGAMAREGLRKPFQGTPTEAVDQTEALLRQALAGQMMADVPLGAFLSGGIDSSTVVALMQSMSLRPIKTFAIGFHEAGYDEAHYAKAVARHIGTEHTELYVTKNEAMAVIPRLASIYCEPFADSSQIPTFLVSQMARRKVTVSLSGDGGDELFCGYNRYDIANRLWPILSRIPRIARSGAARAITALPPRVWDAIARLPLAAIPERKRPRLAGDKLHKAANIVRLNSEVEVYQALISQWQQPSDIVVGGHEPQPTLEFIALLEELGSPMRRMMYQDLTGYMPGDILVKVDRASMAVSLESRVPMLDHRLVEFSWTLPLDILRRDGLSKWPLRQVLYRHVPRNLVERPKTGFGVPIDSWLRGPLRDWAESLLAQDRLSREGFFKPAPIRKAWSDHLSGNRNLHYQLWTVLMFQAWHESLAQPATRVPDLAP